VLPQSALSRVFVKTIGRLGRWKRVLNSRQTVDSGLAVPANVSAFDLELNATGDLLMVRGGVEQYLKMIELPELPVGEKMPLDVNSALGQNQSQNWEAKAKADLPQTPLRAVTEVAEEEEEARESNDIVSEEKRLSITSSVSPDNRRQSIASTSISERVSKRLSISSASISGRLSTRTHSTDSFGSILSSHSRINPLVAQVQAQPPWRFDVVSIDDLDLSDTSSEAHGDAHNLPAPPGLRKPPRKLPLRREFEFVRRSVESVSSMGIRSRDSVASSAGSVVSAVSVSGAAGLGNNIQQWHLNALVDSLSDDDDDGGVEDALRRLEGQINPQKRKEKAKKVDGWVRTIQERMAMGDFGDEQPRFFGQDSEDEGGEDEDETYDIDQHETGSVVGAPEEGDQTLVSTASQVTIGASTGDYFGSLPLEGAVVATLAAKTNDSKPAPEDAVPLEILQSRVPSRPSTSQGSSPAPTQNPYTITSPTKFISSTHKPHRSWVLGVNTDTVVQHFSMIDRELFLGVKPEELILDDWMSCQEVEVLDWAQYLKDRARWKAESRWSQKTSALGAVRGRFNLISNFVVSEIVLTHPSDRAVLVGKFIRVALVSFVLFEVDL